MKTRRLLAFCAAFLLVLGVLSGVSRSAHDGGIECYVCHTLQAGVALIPGTALVNPYVMYEFTQNGWTPGTRLPCTFCHRGMNHPAIPNVLSYVAYDNVNQDYFYGKSRHPVARNYLDNSIGNTPYLSTDNSATPGHLDCVDCHDRTLLTYPNHNDNWLNNVGGVAQRRKSDNPFGLYNVSAPKAYDSFCRSCHGRGVTVFPSGKSIGGRNLEIVSHDNGTAGNPIRDADNLSMRTLVYASADRQCSVCHDAHASMNFHLYSDGRERDWNANPETAIDEFNNCTGVCHYRGDVDNAYDVHGHGKRTFASGNTYYIECTSCHDASSAFHSAKRGGTYFEKYRFRVFDPTFTENSVYGNAKYSVCATCHQEKEIHPTARGSVGCLDCHDPHAKQSGNNVMMIRNTNRVAGSKISSMTPGAGYTVGSEAVRFERSPQYGAPNNLHFYTNDNVAGDTSAGVCDQRACHGASAKQYTPLSVYMSGGQHTGQNQTAGSNCEGCHSHNDVNGSFRAGSSCRQCHGQPPPPTDNTAGEPYPYNETISPHQKHAATTQYAYSCKACHNRYTDANYHNTVITLGYKTFQSVFFDNLYDRGGTGSYDNGTMRCANLYCHSDGAGNVPDNNTFSWYRLDNVLVPSRLGCSGCHKNDSPLPQMATYAHKKHLDYRIRCSACHYMTVSDNNQALNPSTGYTRHVNRTVDVTINPLFDNNSVSDDNWNPALHTCVSVMCHGGKTVDWRVPGPLSCEECHTTVNGNPVAATGYDYTFDNSWAAALTMSRVSDNLFASRGHGRNGALPWDNASNPGGLTCQVCHDPSSLHGNPSNPFRFKSTVNVRAVAFDNITTLCAACHLDIATRSGEHSSVVTGGAQTGLTHTQRCVDCHDVHGQQNIFMVYDSLPSQVSAANLYTNSDGYGIPRSPGVRSAVSFPSDNAGSSFASTTLDNGYTDGICETCHTRTRQFRNASGPNAGPNGHPTRACIECHTHVKGFGGFGGSNVEQYFDNASSATNFRDLSGHPLARGASGGQIPVSGSPPNSMDCLRCHGVSPLGSGLRSNECLRCHHETLDNTYHPDGVYQWSVPSQAPNSTYGSPGLSVDGFCLQCHSTIVGFTAPGTLGGKTPADMVPPLERWTDNNASGHGSATRLSSDTAVGPPQYFCRTCHYSSVAMSTSPNGRDNRAPTFHASVNRKMVGNENAAVHEYPHPNDNVYTDNNVRSGMMDGFCAVKCHQPSNVVRHTWDRLGGGSQADNQTHPSNVPIVAGARYRVPDNLPLSENFTAAPPAGAGNVVCVTCHNPHGGTTGMKDLNGIVLTGGAKQMMRRPFSDNGSTICKECHL